MLQLISRKEDTLLATMTECMLFQNSFRLGAKMMPAVTNESSGI